jgi:predicted transcriptional regulator
MNGQVLVFNSNLSLFDATNTLAEHNIFCAVIWDNVNRKFIELFTIRDILEILVFLTEQLEIEYSGKVQNLKASNTKTVIEFLKIIELNLTKGKTNVVEIDDIASSSSVGYDFLLEVMKSIKLIDWVHYSGKIIDHKPEILVTMSFKDSLFDACREMVIKRIHRIAVVEKTSIGERLCGIITHDMIMGYIISNMQGDPKLFEVPIKELGLDTKELVYKSHRSSLLQVLKCIRDKKISFVPIVDDTAPGGSLPTIGFFSLKDLTKLIRDKKYHMVIY